jgi:hypothetical protein
VTLRSAFVVKCVVLAALAGLADRPFARALQAVADGLAFGSLSQPVEGPTARYLGFAVIAMHLFGLVLLPSVQRHALVARH